MDLTFILFFWGWCTLLFVCGEVQCEYLGMFPKWSCQKLAKCPHGQGNENLESSIGNEVEALSGHCHIPGGWRLVCPEPGGNLPFCPRVCGCVCLRGSTQMSDLRRNPVPEEEDQRPQANDRVTCIPVCALCSPSLATQPPGESIFTKGLRTPPLK